MKSTECFQIFKDEGIPRYDIESFYIGRFVGISICNYDVDHGDYGGIERKYTPEEVFKVHSVNVGKTGLFHKSTTHEVILEAYDHQLFSFYCYISTGREPLKIRGSQWYTRYDWVLDERLVSWIEREYYTKRVRPYINVKFYGSALEVKEAIQRGTMAKEEARQQAQKRADARALQEAAEARAKAARAAAEQQAAADIDNIFYGR